MGRQLPRRVAEGTAGRIMELLRRAPQTVDELSAALKLTASAVRSQLASLERDDLVERRGSRPGTSKPAQLYGVTAQAELLFSRAYIPILTQLLHALSRRMSRAEFDGLIREVARGTMADRVLPRGLLKDRVTNASILLNDLGALTQVEEENGFYVILSHGCPLAAATADHPEALKLDRWWRSWSPQPSKHGLHLIDLSLLTRLDVLTQLYDLGIAYRSLIAHQDRSCVMGNH